MDTILVINLDNDIANNNNESHNIDTEFNHSLEQHRNLRCHDLIRFDPTSERERNHQRHPSEEGVLPHQEIQLLRTSSVQGGPFQVVQTTLGQERSLPQRSLRARRLPVEHETRLRLVSTPTLRHHFVVVVVHHLLFLCLLLLDLRPNLCHFFVLCLRFIHKARRIGIPNSQLQNTRILLKLEIKNPILLLSCATTFILM